MAFLFNILKRRVVWPLKLHFPIKNLNLNSLKARGKILTENICIRIDLDTRASQSK